MTKVVAYVRVSTDGQIGEDKFGIESQKRMITEYCDKNDMEICDWYIDEGESGAKERPGFDEIIYGEINNPPIEKVIVAKNDRVARDIEIYYYYKMMLRKKEIELVSVSEDFGRDGIFAEILEMFTVCAAKMERENITKRTSGGRKIKAAKGGYSGGRTPFGYMVKSKRLEINESEADIVREIFRLSADGMNMLTIAATLNKAGYKTRRDGIFYASNIKSILENRNTYEGMYRYGKDGEWVQGQHEPILKGE